MTDQTTQVTFDWEEVNRNNIVKQAKFEQDGFTCLVQVHLDYDHNFTEFRGTFTNNWEPDAVDYPPASRDNGLFKYFVPENKFDDHYAELLKMGKSPVEAAKMAQAYVHEDMMIAADPESMGCAAYGVTCEVSREMRQKDSQGATYVKKVVLGEAGLWGIEIGERKYDSAPYIDECANEMLAEALEDAKRTLATLRS